MREELVELRQRVLKEIDNAKDEKLLEECRVKTLGKKGDLTQILRGMGKLSPEERPVMGSYANEVRDEISGAIEDKFESLKLAERNKRVQEESLDVTANLYSFEPGHNHPLMETIDELERISRDMGFDVVDGPEIESVANNFEYLNFPKDHPSIGPSDTFYIDEDHVLRTHTSPVQIRYMMENQPPIKMISAGRTFRFDDVDDTHSPMFHQIEGLVVGENISMANLIFTINSFVEALFGEGVKTRFRPHHFPFTEPSAEVDVSCFDCQGKGCEVCNFTGWALELLGCGMVHPNVLRNCGIDPDKYSGFAFGMGVDRITMVKYGIDNIRLLFDNDKRFLKQF